MCILNIKLKNKEIITVYERTCINFLIKNFEKGMLRAYIYSEHTDKIPSKNSKDLEAAQIFCLNKKKVLTFGYLD